MKTLEFTSEKIENLIKESAEFYNLTLVKTEVIDEGDHYWLRLEDDNSNLMSDIIMKDNVISENDLDNQVTAIVEKLA